MEVINALGRRKSAIARIYVKEGKGQITINDRELDKYFAEERLRFIVKQPLTLLSKEGEPGQKKARKRFQFSKR